MKISLARRSISEFVGTAFLVAAIVGFVGRSRSVASKGVSYVHTALMERLPPAGMS